MPSSKYEGALKMDQKGAGMACTGPGQRRHYDEQKAV